MVNCIPRVLLACVMLSLVLLLAQFANSLARADGLHVPVSGADGTIPVWTDPLGAGKGGAELPRIDPGEPPGTQHREGESSGGRNEPPITKPQSAIPVTPIAEPQRNGWPRTTAETTLAGIVASPPASGKWIDVNITQQVLTAYDGSNPIKSVLVSTGTLKHPTVIGTFYVWVKVPSQTMEGGSHEAGDYYKLPGVPDIMYFYEGYALHGAYWHNNFGQPMSHGCINLTLDDAAWLYGWSPEGIMVRTHL